MTAWRCKTSKFCEQFLRFLLEKRPRVKFSKCCSEKSESLHGDTDRRCYVKISRNLSDGKSAKSRFIYLPHKKFRLPLKLSLLHVSHPKFARDSRQHLAYIVQISSKSLHFRGSYSRKRAWTSYFARTIFLWFARSEASLRANNKLSPVYTLDRRSTLHNLTFLQTSKSRDTKIRAHIKNPAPQNLDIVP